ncbi:uncharacterized protein F4812DRAFT_455956 [Daldinia caldariorum]|uniref:uncharacterized protein n=1 Tax=Daldinia caldariorum TaxID=326644 RepID=UPI002007884C|nr:uncharacterized protein F4812DRAFT_455956 [Daldinia caldariorum]KAI1471854.1 hypothetical protein F4812DRAFT_455956 [Daldinia caldariorum]
MHRQSRQSRELYIRRRRLAAEAGRQQFVPFKSSPQDPHPCRNLRSLMRLERVNKAAKKFASLLQDIDYIRKTVRGIIQRAVSHYRKFIFTILKITAYHGLRYFLTTFTCETCGKPGSFRMIKVKVLCEDCHDSKKQPGTE